MAIEVTENTRNALTQTIKEPNLVLEVDGVTTLMGVISIKKPVQIGDPDLFIGDFYIGGLIDAEDQEDAISLQNTTTSIKQVLNIDKAEGSSVTTFQINLIESEFIRSLITPGDLVDDILGRQCRVYLGFKEVRFPDDYALIFRGLVVDILGGGNGLVQLTVSHPENKKRSTIYAPQENKLNGSITSGDTTITVESTTGFLERVLGPSGTYDSSFGSYIRIDNEIIKYDSLNATQFLSCTRAQFNTVAAAHNDESQVSSVYQLTGNAMDLALKVMASGVDGFYLEDLEIESFNVFESLTIPNSIYFLGINAAQKYGIRAGDYITTNSSPNGANNVTNKKILSVVRTVQGSYIVVDGVTFVNETDSIGTASFISEYDTLPDGLRMGSDEMDVDGHLLLKQRFLSNEEYDFRLVEEQEGREFLEKQIYSPVACFSVPKQTVSSVGYHIGPIPGSELKTFDSTNVKKASNSRLRRSLSKQFYNEILYKYEQDVLNPEKFQSLYLAVSATSKNRIKGAGNKTFIIESLGLRDLLSGDNIAQQQSIRRLKRYEFGAEVLTLETLFEVGFSVEIGDVVIVDAALLNIPDTKTGSQGFGPRFFEVQNKEFNIKTGDIKFELVDTSFDGASRYGLISPSSKIKSVISASEFVIEPSFSTVQYGVNEFQKWVGKGGYSVRVRDTDFGLVSDSTLIEPTSNTITLDTPLSFTPTVGMVLELTDYDDINVTDSAKLLYAHMRDSAFADGKSQYNMI